MVLGALLLSSALCGSPQGRGPDRCGSRLPDAGLRLLPRAGAYLVAGTGTMIVGLVPEDAGLLFLHLAGALMFFIGGAFALLLFGVLWLRQSPLGWFILTCGAASFCALVTGGITRMDVPEPGTLERLMGYPITIGLAAVGLVIAQRVRQELKVRKALRTTNEQAVERYMPRTSRKNCGAVISAISWGGVPRNTAAPPASRLSTKSTQPATVRPDANATWPASDR